MGSRPSDTSREEGQTEPAALTIQGTTYETHATRKFLNRKVWRAPDPRKLCCVIPGVIQKIYIRQGQHVDRGDPLLVLEAMKMQNDILSTAEGTVHRVHVAPGDQVARGQLLIELN